MTMIGFEIDDEELQKLDVLRLQIGAETGTEVFNHGMSLLKWVVEQIAEGRVVASLHLEDKNMRQLDMPIFANIERSTQ